MKEKMQMRNEKMYVPRATNFQTEKKEKKNNENDNNITKSINKFKLKIHSANWQQYQYTGIYVQHSAFAVCSHTASLCKLPTFKSIQRDIDAGAHSMCIAFINDMRITNMET